MYFATMQVYKGGEANTNPLDIDDKQKQMKQRSTVTG